LFESTCAYYLSIGMSYSQFWDDDPLIAKHYYKAQQLKSDRRNQELWLQGIYVGLAFGANKNDPYPGEPLPRTERQAAEQAKRRYDAKVMQFRERAAQINTKRKGGAQE